MPFSQDEGYVPVDISAIMDAIRGYVNTQFGTTYTTEQFVGTNFYKYFYALAQRIAENETKTAEIFIKLQEYIDFTNERISRPVATNPGIIEKLETEGWIASVKPMIEADAGEINICVDVDDSDPDYADFQLAIATIIKDSTAAGCVTMGTESQAIVLSNGQSFDFKYHLPDRKTTLLRLTTVLSENNQLVIGDPDDTKATLLANISANYRLGKNFEPQRYFGIVDAPWAESVLLEYSINAGADWSSAVYNANFDDLFERSLADVTLVES
jgi:hypothetical protein